MFGYLVHDTYLTRSLLRPKDRGGKGCMCSRLLPGPKKKIGKQTHGLVLKLFGFVHRQLGSLLVFRHEYVRTSTRLRAHAIPYRYTDYGPKDSVHRMSQPTQGVRPFQSSNLHFNLSRRSPGFFFFFSFFFLIYLFPHDRVGKLSATEPNSPSLLPSEHKAQRRERRSPSLNKST